MAETAPEVDKTRTASLNNYVRMASPSHRRKLSARSHTSGIVVQAVTEVQASAHGHLLHPRPHVVADKDVQQQDADKQDERRGSIASASTLPRSTNTRPASRAPTPVRVASSRDRLWWHPDMAKERVPALPCEFFMFAETDVVYLLAAVSGTIESALLQRMGPVPGEDAVAVIDDMYTLGRYGGKMTVVVHVMDQWSLLRAVHLWRPRSVLLVSSAAGANPGDVLVSSGLVYSSEGRVFAPSTQLEHRFSAGGASSWLWGTTTLGLHHGPMDGDAYDHDASVAGTLASAVDTQHVLASALPHIDVSEWLVLAGVSSFAPPVTVASGGSDDAAVDAPPSPASHAGSTSSAGMAIARYAAAATAALIHAVIGTSPPITRSKGNSKNTIIQLPMPQTGLVPRPRLYAALHATVSSKRMKPATAVSSARVRATGKSVLVQQYAWRRRDDYSLVWWVDASSRLRLSNSYQALAQRLGIARNGRSHDALVSFVIDALNARGSFLLIFDDLPSPSFIVDYVPDTSRSKTDIIVTTPLWPLGLDVPSFTLDEVWRLTAGILGAPEPADKEVWQSRVATLAQQLEYNPLAVQLACSYMLHHSVDPTEYLALYSRNRTERRTSRKHGLNTVMETVLHITLRRADRVATQIFNTAAWYDARDIPIDLFLSETTEPTAVFSAVGFLAMHGLLQADAMTVTMPMAVREAVRGTHGPRLRKRYVKAAVAAIDTRLVFSLEEPETYAATIPLLPHAAEVCLMGREHRVHDTDYYTVEILNKLVAYYQYVTGDFIVAVPLQETAIDIDVASYNIPDDHPTLLWARANFGALLANAGRHEDAVDAFREVAEMVASQSGVMSLKYAHALDDLAYAYYENAQYLMALDTALEAVAIDEKQFQQDSTDRIIHLLHLAEIQIQCAGAATAVKQARQAFNLATKRHGPRSLLSLEACVILAAALHATAAYADANATLRPVVDIIRDEAGPDAPLMMRALTQLADSQRALGASEDALVLMEEASAIARRVYSPRQAARAQVDHIHALCLLDVGSREEGKAMLEQAQEVLSVFLPTSHYAQDRCREDLADLFHRLAQSLDPQVAQRQRRRRRRSSASSQSSRSSGSLGTRPVSGGSFVAPSASTSTGSRKSSHRRRSSAASSRASSRRKSPQQVPADAR